MCVLVYVFLLLPQYEISWDIMCRLFIYESIYSAVRCWWVYMQQCLNSTKINQYIHTIRAATNNQLHYQLFYMRSPLSCCRFAFVFLAVNCCSRDIFVVITVHRLFFNFKFIYLFDQKKKNQLVSILFQYFLEN